METKKSIYQTVTDKIVEELTKGIIPWHMPWSTDGFTAINYKSRKSYSFLNQMILLHCYQKEPGEFLTFNQVKELGGRIKKGSKAGRVTFFKFLEHPKEIDEQTGLPKKIPFLRYYNVFQINDVEGIESKLPPFVFKENNPIEEAEKIINNYLNREKKLTFEAQYSAKAFYQPLNDCVTVPFIKQFDNSSAYYSTVFHELIHSTMHADRLNRVNKGKKDKQGYSREELIAEMGAAMLCSYSGLEIESTFKNSTAYIQHWLTILTHDEKAVVYAAGKAEKAVKYILGIKEETV